jgi:glycosyltransferase involved in cell wall biosynthesis
MPVYNESRLLPKVIERFDAVPPPHGLVRRLVIVDDGSSDSTPELVRQLASRPDVVTRLHQKNQGKGAAVRTAWKAALDAGADLLLIHDADLEYGPRRPRRRAPPHHRRARRRRDRFPVPRRDHRVLYYWHSVANRLITTASNMLTNLNLTDIECCSKAITRRAAEKLTIEEDRFGLEPEIVAKLARLKLPGPDGVEYPARVYEVPVSYAGRTYADGKKITWRDAVSALRCILKYAVR